MNKSIQFVKFTTTLNAYDCLDELAEEHYKWTEQKLKNYAYKRLKCRFHYLEQYPGLQFTLSEPNEYGQCKLQITYPTNIDRELLKYCKNIAIPIQKITSYADGNKEKFNLYVKAMHEWAKKKKNNKKLRKEDFLKDLNISRSTFFRYQKIYEELTEAQKENIIQQVGD